MRDTIYVMNTRIRLWTDQLGQRAAQRWDDERGQTAAEYLGVVLLVAVIIAAVVTSGVGETIKRELQDIVEAIVGGKDPKGEGVNDPTQ